ncbi:MAG: repair protein RecN [Actinomycetota bacterium]
MAGQSPVINEIFIRDLGVISSARMTFTPGFTAVTGETGAGKTMVVSALGLLLGDRADSAVVRTGSERASVEGYWSITDSVVADAVEELGGAVDDGEVITSRVVSVEGRSRASVGGAAVPIGALGEFGSTLVAIHGQSDQIRLKSASAQRDALDRFAGVSVTQPLVEFRELFDQWNAAVQRQAELVRDAAVRAVEAESLREAVAEIEAVAPVAGEDQRLKEIAERLANADDLRRAAHEAHEALSSESGSADAIGLIETARRTLERVASSDPAMETLVTLLSEASIVAREAAQGVSAYAAGLEVDGGDLAEIQERSAAIAAIIRKFGPTLDDVLSLLASASDRLCDLDRTSDEITELDEHIVRLHTALEALSAQISSGRADAASRLSAAVTAEIRALSMPTATFHVTVTPSPVLTSHGADIIEFSLTPHPGTEPRPVAKSASGGELSRIMLALEVAIAGTDSVPTMVFDEVDSGVGGASALEIGRRLSRLARNAQVIVVTHLAQVAAFADNHLTIVKDTSGEFTESTITTLDDNGRISEIARLLSGTPDSDTARAHAQELLDAARDFRDAL